ncbi:TcpQ domain-containing protein [Achromobacter xylosoxidans]|uniref:TcpQ domain-containing protein n=1 Tax=Alcaligenes xylosoxydans xylosoxydans TaxID=85698 RepID=UPI00047ACFB1|nr:TcpQ domain-containing protein [Achromobacter xylosoxidans]
MQQRLTHLLATAWVALLAPIAATAQPELAAPIPAVYEFNWKQSGDSGISPVQIFDNGQRVYLQFAPGTEIPAIFADAPGGRILLAWEAQSPYIVVPHMESRLAFRLGKREALAWRAGIPPEGSYTGMATPVRLTGSAATPATREQLAFRRTTADAAAGPDPSYRPIVVSAPPVQAPAQAPAQPIVASVPDGSSLSTFMSTAIGGPLLGRAAGEPERAANAVAPAVGPPSPIATVDVATGEVALAPPPERSWQAEVGKTVQQTLDAWAQEAGWQPVKWQPDFDYVMEAPASFRGEFLDAANDLLSAYDAAKRKFRGLAYRDNKVLEVWEKK